MPRRKLTNMLAELALISKGLRDHLEQATTLRRRAMRKDEPLLMPGMDVNEAHYIYKGLVKFYWKDMNNEEEIFMFGLEGEIVLLSEEFFDGEKSKNVYISMVTAGEIYSITKAQMDEIYLTYPEAQVMTNKIRSRIMEKRNLHTRILMRKEGDRYALFREHFRELDHWLKAKEIMAFIRIGKSLYATTKAAYLIKSAKNRILEKLGFW